MGQIAIEDLWRVTLSQIPSVLGRLVYLSGLRDPNIGRYAHQGLAMRFGEDGADQAIRQSHEEAFRNWLAMPMREKREDAELYWSSLLQDERVVNEVWRKAESYRALLPIAASPAQRLDFQTHMEILLLWIKRVLDDAALDPGASQRL
jgi:hypothetical protein